MGFLVHDEVFAVLPHACFGAVVLKGVNNECPQAYDYLRETEEAAREKLTGCKIKDHPLIVPYREAFRALGYNPNKFLPSVEALAARILKGGRLPDINPVVNLANAVSLKYLLPMGAHDIGTRKDIALRLSSGGDTFHPFGGGEEEEVPPGEVVYASGRDVRTRRWIWRQSEKGKVTSKSADIFIPIDGFSGFNAAQVVAARDELAGLAQRFLGIDPGCFFLDANNRRAEFS